MEIFKIRVGMETDRQIHAERNVNKHTPHLALVTEEVKISPNKQEYALNRRYSQTT